MTRDEIIAMIAEAVKNGNVKIEDVLEIYREAVRSLIKND